jgi:hypothetical protein
MRHPRHLLPILLVAGLVAAGCGGTAPLTDQPDQAPAAPTDDTSNGEASGDTTSGGVAPVAQPDDDATDTDDGQGATEVGQGATEVAVYFVRSGDSGIWVEPEAHDLDGPTTAVARAAMEILFRGDTHDQNLTSTAPDGVQVLATNIVNRILIVDVSDDIVGTGYGSAQELAFAQQLAHTGTAFVTIDAVQLWVDGAPIDELWGHLDWSRPIVPDPFALSPVTIETATVQDGRIVLSGQATVFEATIGIRLYRADGTLVTEAFVMASDGAPERGTWAHTFTAPGPGTYTVEASEDDPSDGEGRPPFTTTRQVTVS